MKSFTCRERLEAVKKINAGADIKKVAEKLEVSKGIVLKWEKAYRAVGEMHPWFGYGLQCNMSKKKVFDTPDRINGQAKAIMGPVGPTFIEALESYRGQISEVTEALREAHENVQQLETVVETLRKSMDNLIAHVDVLSK